MAGLCRRIVLGLVAGLCAIPLAWAEPAPANGPRAKPGEVFADMLESFQPAKARGVHARYQWKLSGPDGGLWWVIVDDGVCQMGNGLIEQPDVTFIVSDKDWVGLANGTLGGLRAFLTGRLKVSGNIGLARKLDEMFP